MENYTYNPLSGEWDKVGTVYNGDIINNPDNEDITVDDNNQLKLADRTAVSGKGYKILRRGVDLQTQFSQENTIYEVRYDYDLNRGTLNIPDKCALKFEGGSLSNGTIKGANSTIIADYKIFDNVSVEGSWSCDGDARWFATPSKTSIEGETLQITGKIDCTAELQSALDSTFSRLNITGFYYITNTLNLLRPKEIVMSGTPFDSALYRKKSISGNKTFIFTDKDVTMLRIAPIAIDSYSSNRICIRGGNFDATLCSTNYTSDMIVVDISQNSRIWGLNIACGIYGNPVVYTFPNGRGIVFKTGSGEGYASMIRIDSIIQGFEKGIEIMTKMPTWITDVIVNGEIRGCQTAIRSNTDVYMNASIQPNYFFTSKDNNIPLIDCVSGRWVIGGMIWDVGNSSVVNNVTMYTNNIAIHNENADIKLTGKTVLVYNGQRSGSQRHKISGDKRFLIKEDFTMADRYNFTPKLEGDCLEAFDKRGKVEVSLKSADGEVMDGLTANNIDRMFNINKTHATLSLDDYTEDGRYIEINLTGDYGLNAPIIMYVAFFAYNKSAFTDFGFRNYEITLNYKNGSNTTIYSEVNNTTYGKYEQFELNTTTHAHTESITIKLHNVYSSISIGKIMAVPKVDPYTHLYSPYLPISGGEVYGDVEFKGILKCNQSGNTRPQTSRINAGYQFFDTTLSKPIWWTGTKWVDATGTTV